MPLHYFTHRFFPFSYQWNFNGTNIDGATNVSLVLANVQTNQAGSYSVTITNTFGGLTSSNAVLSVYSSVSTDDECRFVFR